MSCVIHRLPERSSRNQGVTEEVTPIWVLKLNRTVRALTPQPLPHERCQPVRSGAGRIIAKAPRSVRSLCPVPTR